jgi:hypothetical protein
VIGQSTAGYLAWNFAAMHPETGCRVIVDKEDVMNAIANAIDFLRSVSTATRLSLTTASAESRHVGLVLRRLQRLEHIN